MAAIQGTIIAQDEFWRSQITVGSQFNVRDLFAEQWFEDYMLRFAQKINDTSSKEISAILQQAVREGWSVDTGRKRLRQVFEQWITGDVAPDLLEWIETRLPPHRLDMIVRTETVRAANAGSQQLFTKWGIEEKEWLTAGDRRVRPTHRAASGQIQPMDEPFIVGGAELMFPLDPNGPPSETIQCRCVALPLQ